MIKLFKQWLECLLDVIEIHEPTGDRVNITGNRKTHKEGVPMQASAFVPFGYVGQSVRGLESKIFIKLHVSVLMKNRLWHSGCV